MTQCVVCDVTSFVTLSALARKITFASNCD